MKKYKCEIEEIKQKREGVQTYWFGDDSSLVAEHINGIKEGVWLYYDPFGNEIKSQLYKIGQLEIQLY